MLKVNDIWYMFFEVINGDTKSGSENYFISSLDDHQPPDVVERMKKLLEN